MYTYCIFANKSQAKELRKEAKRHTVSMKRAQVIDKNHGSRYALDSMLRKELKEEADTCYQLQSPDINLIKGLVNIWRRQICK